MQIECSQMNEVRYCGWDRPSQAVVGEYYSDNMARAVAFNPEPTIETGVSDIPISLHRPVNPSKRAVHVLKRSQLCGIQGRTVRRKAVIVKVVRLGTSPELSG